MLYLFGPACGTKDFKEGDAQIAQSRLFSGIRQVENQLIKIFLEYCSKSGVTVNFSEIYSKPFGNPHKHWKFLTKKLTQFDEKINWTYGKAI